MKLMTLLLYDLDDLDNLILLLQNAGERLEKLVVMARDVNVSVPESRWKALLQVV